MIKMQTLKQLFLYLVVGGCATVVEWVAFYGLDILLQWHYALATAAAFAISTFANWSFGRLLLFHTGNAKGLLYELVSIYLVSIAGLAANLLIMWLAIDIAGLNDMQAKIIATGIVFAGNFMVRKYFIYKV